MSVLPLAFSLKSDHCGIESAGLVLEVAEDLTLKSDHCGIERLQLQLRTIRM